MEDGKQEDEERARRSESMAGSMPSFGKRWLSEPEQEEEKTDDEDSGP